MLYVLGEAALRTAFLAGILQSVLSALRIQQTRVLLAAWTVVLATSLMMPLLLRSSPLHIPLDDAVPRALISNAADLLQQPSLPRPTDTASSESKSQLTVEAWVEILYIVVGSSLGLRVLLGVGLSLQILSRAIPTFPEWALGMRVRLSQDVTGPVTIGQTIVLPNDVVQWPMETRHAVLAHEYAHVARMDYAMLVMSQLNRAVFWFSPLSWWLHRRLNVLAELASDDQAIERTRDRIGYAEILLEMAQRSAPVSRGPSMASLSTLPLRIDRILLNQVTSSQVSRLTLATLKLVVAAFSLTVANLAPSVSLEPAVMKTNYLSIRRATVEKPSLIAPAGTLQPSDSEPKPWLSSDPMPLALAPSVAAPHQVVKAVVRPRIAVQTLAKSMPYPSVVKSAQKTRAALDYERDKLISRQEVIDENEAVDGHLDQRSATQTNDILSIYKDDSPRFRRAVDTPLRSELDQLNGDSCDGTVAVGMRAYYSSALPTGPNVVAGQIVTAKAQFFQKSDGSSWVRFGAFDRPPLDLTVQPTRTGFTWTGEYGITYAVQKAGGGRLVGLAAKIANDSAALSFNCKKTLIP